MRARRTTTILLRALLVVLGTLALALLALALALRSYALEVSDDLTDPKLQLAPRLEKVIENGFVLGLQEALKRTYSGKTEASSDQHPTPLKAQK